MKIFYKITILITICFFIANAAQADVKSVTVDGFCYLEGATDHSGTKVLFTAVSPSAETDSTLTNADGSYSIGLTLGVYTVAFSHAGWQPYEISGDLSFFENTTLDDIVLLSGFVEEVLGPQSGVWTPDILYKVIGDVSVSSDDTLVIEPGVTIKFMDDYSFDIFGLLLAEGTETDSIFFTSGQTNGAPEDWNQISFEQNSNDNSVISYACIEYAYYGINCYYSSPSISNSTISKSSQCGIVCSNSTASISYNTLVNNNFRGIIVWNASPTIENNIINNHLNGIYCYLNSAPIINNNYISNSTEYGIHCVSSTPVIINNTLIDNANGVYCYSSISLVISKNTFSNNDCGIYSYSYCSPNVLNNIFFSNTIGIEVEVEPSSLEYNLFWDNNTTATGDGLPLAFGEIVTINGNGDPCDSYLNLFMNPLFVDPVNLDFHLTENSPCVDAGNPDSVYYDPDGTIADIGAYFYPQLPPPVIVDFLGEPTEGVANLLVQFSPEVTGQVTSYSWDFGDGGSSSLLNPAHTYTKSGSYRVGLTVEGPGGNTTLTKQEYITVFDPQLVPQPDFSAEPVSGYAPLEVAFTNLTIGEFESVLWDFGDGTTSTQTNPTHEYQNSGLFTVSLTAYNIHGYDTETKLDYIEVLESEEVTTAFEVSGNYGCSPFTVTFNNQSTGSINSYLWDFGDGETSIEENPEHTFIGANEYTVLLTVSGLINTDTAEEIITVELAEPFITSIEDRPNDQGGFVYLNFTKSFYDNVVPEDGVKSTEGYSFQRLDNEDWVSVSYLYATGEENYTVELTTLADSTATSLGLTTFRVVAGMDEGTWISEAAEGYSVDNIAPAVPEDFEGLFADGQIELQWQPCPDEDFQYFAIYKTDESGQFEVEPFATTISNQIADVVGDADCSYKVSAIDFNGNQSQSSEILVAQMLSVVGGWTSLSAYVDPSYPEMENIFNGINDELIIVQNMTGAYCPSQGMNTLGEWDNNSGYFVKAISDVNLLVIGKKYDVTSLNLNAGWNLIPVLSECPAVIAELFDGIDVVMIKEIAGTNIYWPESGVFTLEELLSGKAYFVLVGEEGTIYFPECDDE